MKILGEIMYDGHWHWEEVTEVNLVGDGPGRINAMWNDDWYMCRALRFVPITDGKHRKPMKLNPQQLGTILAALRYAQDTGAIDKVNAMPQIKEEGLKPTTYSEIDKLCEYVNGSEECIADTLASRPRTYAVLVVEPEGPMPSPETVKAFLASAQKKLLADMEREVACHRQN